MWVTLQEAVDILTLEMGCDSFANTPSYVIPGTSQFSTTGSSTTLAWTGLGGLLTLLSVGDLIVISQIGYSVISVNTNSAVIDTAINLTTNTSWNKVLLADAVAYQAFNKLRNQALYTAYKRLLRYVVTPETPVQVAYQEAQSHLACLYMRTPMRLRGNTNIVSESLGDMSYSYDLSKIVEPIPYDIIQILGALYIGIGNPVFFRK